jgi:hypothetical protein
VPPHAVQATRPRRAAFWVEDLYPPLSLPAMRFVLAATRRRHREIRRREASLRTRVSGDGRVAGGPFASMRYLDVATGSPLLPKLAGTYELEVAEFVERAIAAQPDLVVDVGAAEGYYAVGLALRLPGARVVAFEARRSARYLLRRLARRNGVAPEIHGSAGTAALEAVLATAARPFVVCDVDGAEERVIDPERVPSLARAHLLVETHDEFVPGVTRRLQERLAATHDVERRDVQQRPAGLLPGLEAADFAAVVDERRPPQSWLSATPRWA